MARLRRHTSIINDVSSILRHMRDNRDFYLVEAPPEELHQPEKKASERYKILLNDNERDHYYSDVAICRFLFYDIARGTNMAVLKRYAPHIGDLDHRDVDRIFYDPESEDFVIQARHREVRIYRGDVRYIYPLFCQVRDPIEYELVFDGDKVYSLNKFNDGAEASANM